MDTSNITLCLTIGRRPQLLRQTLESLFKHAQFEHIIAINDFGDEETNVVFKELCPHGKLICLGQQLGHHPAVDHMYKQVNTDYIFHCEDDWYFDDLPDFQQMYQLLSNSSDISNICLRQYTDFPLSPEEKEKIQFSNVLGIDIVRLDPLHAQWHGYTFNPHIAKKQIWQNFDCHFAQFKKERHISRVLRAQGKYTAYLKHGACHHIGEHDSVANVPKVSFLSRMKGWFSA
ncbi:glycosyltransferase [Acinetobacter rathckeae]|uniref:glycosyltransferase n=1 Tax=Acinetobacter rathckeae TaxID=2605272 RepID=UPI0018A2E6A2|nr:glycosyltransferase [Acinetobacter rathckeae]MBF7695945.1 glycosyltransferase [Acinetobacter rathckeae]